MADTTDRMMALTSKDFETAALRLSVEEFATEHQYPFLLVVITPDAGTFDFRTVRADTFESSQAKRLVVPIRKRQGANLFSFITLGRVANNDIVIPSSSVSKCHAIIHRQEDGYAIADAGSKNGTRVNQSDIGRWPPIVLHKGDVVVLSSWVSAAVIEPATAYQWLRTWADAGPS